MKIKLLDNYMEFESPLKAIEIADRISKSLAKKCVGAKLNGELVDLNTIISEDSSLTFLTDKDEESLHILNHSTAHLMAEAIKELYPNACFGVGPAIEEGYYYDFYIEGVQLTETDFKQIEKKMVEHANKAEEVVRNEVSKVEALELFKNDRFKLELIKELKDDEVISVYFQGNYFDLCRGPHVLKTSMIKHFKLLSIAGSYWRGDAKRDQMQRIYGCSFFNDEEEGYEKWGYSSIIANRCVNYITNPNPKGITELPEPDPEVEDFEYEIDPAILNHPNVFYVAESATFSFRIVFDKNMRNISEFTVAVVAK